MARSHWRARDADTPFIFVSERSERICVNGLKNGAIDYV